MEAELKAAKSTAISKRPIFMFSFNNRFEPMLKMYTSERVVAIYLVVLGPGPRRWFFLGPWHRVAVIEGPRR
jgi:hypothetical protein